MTIGANAGGQLNLILFEVGIVTTDPVSGVETVSTVSVHPLLVAPQSIDYGDNGRSIATKTTGGSAVTKGGRDLRSVSLQGVFGVASRGLGPYVGSGETRFQRFYREVVRMSEALDAADVDAAIDIIHGTPFISLLTAAFVPGASVFFINFYDFWNDIAFQALVPRFNWRRQSRQGGATGNVSYTLQVQEVGLLKEGGLGNTIIGPLMSILGTWDDINDVLAGTTIQDVIDANVAVAAIGASELADTVEAVTAQVQAVTGLMGGNARTSLASGGNDGLAAFFANAQRAAAQAEALAGGLGQSLGSGTLDSDAGAIAPAAVKGEGGNRLLDTFELQANLGELAEALRFQLHAGVFFGMSREEYREFIAAGGVQGTRGPDLRGSLRHVTSELDTPASLEARYGVSWASILEVNGLTPDEALFPGAVFQIPRTRARGPQGIKGLPVFGSHVGRAAWGRDLPLELRVDEDGKLVTIDDEECLAQGATLLIEEFGDGLLQNVNAIPPGAQARYVERRVQALLLSDDRYVGVESVAVNPSAAGGFEVEATIHAINGSTLRTGGATA